MAGFDQHFPMSFWLQKTLAIQRPYLSFSCRRHSTLLPPTTVSRQPHVDQTTITTSSVQNHHCSIFLLWLTSHPRRHQKERALSTNGFFSL